MGFRRNISCRAGNHIDGMPACHPWADRRQGASVFLDGCKVGRFRRTLRRVAGPLCLAISLSLFGGCARVPVPQPLSAGFPVKVLSPAGPAERKIPADIQNVKDKTLRSYAQKKGVVFAKVDFQGVLKAAYVKLLFDGQGEGAQKFYLQIEDRPGEYPLWGKGKTVKPGYFFIELPAGLYKISSLSIPVGSTLATEPIDISFEVVPNTVVYMGTLRVVGTKEKIKIGGLPVIQPGFEYAAEVLDEREEGVFAFRQRYPNISVEIATQLMDIYPLDSGNQ